MIVFVGIILSFFIVFVWDDVRENKRLIRRIIEHLEEKEK